MEYIKYNKTVCGVDFLINIIGFNALQLRCKTNTEISNNRQTADFFQIVFINKGNGNLRLNDQSIKLTDNSVVFISKNYNYQWDINSDDFDATFLIFQEDFLNDFFSDKYFTYRLLYFYQKDFPLYINLSDKIFHQYLTRLEEARIDLIAPKSDSVHIIRSILYYVLIQLNRTYANKNKIKSTIAQDNIAYQFRKLVEVNFHQKRNIEDYTSLMNISRISLNKAIKKQFNVTSTEFIKSRLMFELKMKLIFTNKTIKELSNEFNFSEPNHLSRFFKSKEGTTPLSFRSKNQNGRH